MKKKTWKRPIGPHKRAFLEESRYIFPRARALANRAGFNLKQLSKNHYMLIPPGRQFGINVFSSHTGGTWNVGMTWHEKQLDLKA